MSMTNGLKPLLACFIPGLFFFLPSSNAAERPFAPPKTLTPLPASEPRAMEFELTDQNGRTHTYRFPRRKVSVLLFGDRDGAEQLEGWIRPLAERYNERIDIQGVAELSSVPTLARSMVRRIMRREIKYPVMLDWEGDVSKNYGNQKGVATIVVITRDGRIACRTNGPANQPELERLYKAIENVM